MLPIMKSLQRVDKGSEATKVMKCSSVLLDSSKNNVDVDFTSKYHQVIKF